MTLKVITVFVRRADMTRPQFRSYYEGHHVLLALANVSAFGFHKYLRNHVIGAAVDPGFDCLSEFHFPDAAQSLKAVEFMKTPAGRNFAEDELNFLDMNNHPSIPVNESVLVGPPRTVDRVPTHKQMLLVKGAPGSSPEEVAARVAAFGREFAARQAGALHRLTLDVPMAGTGVPSPFDALLTLWPTPTTWPDLQWPGRTEWSRRIDVEAIEATREQLGQA